MVVRWEQTRKANEMFEINSKNVREIVDKHFAHMSDDARYGIMCAATEALDAIFWDVKSDESVCEDRQARRLIVHIGNAYKKGVTDAYEAMQHSIGCLI